MMPLSLTIVITAIVDYVLGTMGKPRLLLQRTY